MLKMRNAIPALLCLWALILTGCGAMAAETTAEPARQETPVTPAYDLYEPFGLTYDSDTDTLTFDGQTVRYFLDGVELADGIWSVRCEHISRQGTVDVHTIRTPLQNGDGSVDPFGVLTGVEADCQEEFDMRDMDTFRYPSLEAATAAEGDSFCPSGESFTDRFATYRDFGIEYVEAPNASGAGNVYCNGELIGVFIDISAGGTFTFHSADGGETAVRTVYDGQGKLTGIKEVTDAELWE